VGTDDVVEETFEAGVRLELVDVESSATSAAISGLSTACREQTSAPRNG